MPVVPGSLTVIVLAAGGGARLGGGKLLLPWRGRPLVAHAVDQALALERAASVVVVIGHEAERVRLAVDAEPRDGGPPVRYVENRDWREGQGSSLRLGIEAVMAGAAARTICGAMVLLADQPCVRHSTLAKLADEHARAVARSPGHPATAPFCGGGRGNPVIVSPVLFPRLLELRGDVGARYVIAELGASLLLVPVDDPGIHRDVDTPDDYAALADGAS